MVEVRVCDDPIGLHRSKGQTKWLPVTQRGRICSTCRRHKRIRGLTARGITRLCADGCGRTTTGDTGLARPCRQNLAWRRRQARFFTRQLGGRAMTYDEMRVALRRPHDDPDRGVALKILTGIVEALYEGRVALWGLKSRAWHPTAKAGRRRMRAHQASA